MMESSRRRVTYACVAIIAIVIPLSILLRPLNLLVTLGLAAIYYLWFSRATLWVGIGIAAAMMNLAILGDIGTVTYCVFGILVPGMTIAVTRRMGWGFSAALASACVIPLIGLLAYQELLSHIVASFGDWFRAVAANSQMAEIYPPAEYQRMVEFANRVADNMLYFLPGVLLSNMVFLYGIGTMLGESLVTRSGIFSFRIPPFTMWKLDEWMVLPVGVAVLFVIVDVMALNLIGWNALVFLFVLFSLCGLSFLEYQLRTHKIPLIFKVCIYIFLFLTQIVAGVVLPLIALFDAKFDFRKIRAKQLG